MPIFTVHANQKPFDIDIPEPATAVLNEADAKTTYTPEAIIKAMISSHVSYYVKYEWDDSLSAYTTQGAGQREWLVEHIATRVTSPGHE